MVEKGRRLRQMRPFARMKRSIVNESPSQRESRLNNERLRSKQRCVNESEAQRVARLDDQRQRSQQ
uniref:IBB domain-containing protein n=1 Tax=Amphimedon queenslandica TaxID=400682 RepID=A0A1X7SUM9_AMPQE